MNGIRLKYKDATDLSLYNGKKMSLAARRTVFLILIMLLTGQGYVIHDLGEPYPAVWAPGFPGGVRKSTYTKPIITFAFGDGSRRTVLQKELLQEFPDSHHDALMSFFRPLTNEPQTTRRLYKLFPGYNKGQRERAANLPIAWQWFKKQSQRLFGRNDPSSVDVEWNTYRFSDHQLLERSGTYKVSDDNN